MPEPIPSLPAASAERLAAALTGLLSPLAAPASVVLDEGRGAAALAALPGPLAALTCRLTRGAAGKAGLMLSGGAGLGLARLLLGEAGPAPAAPGPEEEDALKELANQVAGALSSALGSLLGAGVGFEGAEAAWLAEGGRALTDWADAACFTVQLRAGELGGEGLLALPQAAARALVGPAPGREPALPALAEAAPAPAAGGMELLLDVTLPVTVELGRARMMIRDILHLAPGSVLELDKLAGEPVDILINDKSIARGEVVVVDESFGVRLTSIVAQSERVANLR
ncbi:MAG: flagellar motor switch protein FliN [Candidatus Methylomirabilales bacterium]